MGINDIKKSSKFIKSMLLTQKKFELVTLNISSINLDMINAKIKAGN